MIYLCYEYLSVSRIWLYVAVIFYVIYQNYFVQVLLSPSF